MTTRTKHTPTPWARGEVRCNQVLGGGRSGRAEVVCSGSDNANLDFVVLACNSHDDLVAALEGVLLAAEEHDFDLEQQPWADAKAALAKAGA